MTPIGSRPPRALAKTKRWESVGAGCRAFDEVDGAGVALDIARVLGHVVDMDDTLGADRAANGSVRAEFDNGVGLSRFNKRWRRSMQRQGPQSIAFGQPHYSELGLADAHCIREHSLEHRP